MTAPVKSFRFQVVKTFLQNLSSKKGLRLVYTALTILLTVGVLGFIVYRQRDVLLDFEWQFRIGPALLSFVLFSLGLLLVAAVWAWILNTLGARLSYLKHIRYYCIANIAKRIPGTIWYIASRAQMYKQDGVSRKLTSIASGVELAVGLMSGILASLFFALPTIVNYRISPFVFAGAFVLGVILTHPRVMQRLFRLVRVEIKVFSYKRILGWLATYFLVWILGGGVLFAIGNAITPIPFQYLGYFIGSWSLVGVLSSLLLLSPSNLGVTEIGLSLLLAKIMPAPIAVIISIAARVLMILFEGIWAVFFLWIKPAESD